MMKRVSLALASLLGIPFLIAGCSPTPESPTRQQLTLKQTYDHLRTCYERHAYLAIHAYIDPMHAEQVVDLLVAIDELMAANAGALQAVKQACPGLSVERFDLAGITDTLALFARHIEFAGQQENGSEGIIRVQVAGRSAPSELRFRRQDGCWLYQPDPATAKLVPVLQEIAKALHRIRAIAPSQNGPEEISDEYRMRVGPKLQRVSELVATTRPA